MKITPTTLTLSQLFSSNNEQFFIPAYQRRYSWEYKQFAELFDDIDLLNENDTHLLGTIVCLTDIHSVGINKLELVDGQQRITTLTIFLKAIRNRFYELNDNDVTNEIDGLLECRGVDRKTKNKVLLGDLDNPDYEKLLNDSNIDEVINKNLLDCYNYFQKWLSEFNLEDLNSLYYKFINNLILIRLDVGNAKDAYKLFETINNRGLKLRPTDIIKNFLLGHASAISEETLSRVQNNWKTLIIELDSINSDDFFRQMMCGELERKVTFTYLIDFFKGYYLNKVTEAEELQEYQYLNDNYSFENITNKLSIIKFSEYLKNIAKIYRKIIKKDFENKTINQHLFNLERIKSQSSYILLLNLFKREDISEKEYIEILKSIETFMLRRHICEYRTGELDNIFSRLVKLNSLNIVNLIKKELIKELPKDEEFVQKFSTTSFRGNENRAKYILETLEYNMINHVGEYTLNKGKELHLEHIIPKIIDTKKSKNEYGDWQTYLGENSLILHKDYINRIGNFTLLGQKLNIAASNNPFDSKIEEYKKSNISLTKQLIDNYTQFKFEEIEKRSKLISEDAKEIWKF